MANPKDNRHVFYRQQNELSLGEALKQLVEAYRLKPKLNESRLRATWAQLMGPSINKHTTRIVLSASGNLQIYISSSALRQELHYAKDKIRELVNKEFQEEVVKTVEVF